MKITMVLDLLIDRGELASAWLISRACRPGNDLLHLALELGLRHQSCDRIDHQHVDRARAPPRMSQISSACSPVHPAAGDQEFVDIDAELARIDFGSSACSASMKARRCRPSSGPRPPCAAPAWSCRDDPGP